MEMTGISTPINYHDRDRERHSLPEFGFHAIRYLKKCYSHQMKLTHLKLYSGIDKLQENQQLFEYTGIISGRKYWQQMRG